MSTVLSHDAYHPSVGHAFGELRVLEQLSQLPPDSVLRILQSIPKPLLQQALEPAGTAEQWIDEVGLDQEERRSTPRRKVLRGALVLRGGKPLIEVQLRDISEGGCRIWSRTPGDVPDVFTLRIVGIDGEQACEVRWRRADEMGVAFLNAASRSPAPGDAHAPDQPRRGPAPR